MNFPLAKARLMNDYQGDDDASMEDNNTSAFNSRKITGGSKRLSLHAYGTAIDINPVQNPFVSFDENNPGLSLYKPANGTQYANRQLVRFGKLFRTGMSEEISELFAEQGFIYWGGYWDTPIDYQHFQVSREMSEFMALAPAELASEFFNQYVLWIQAFKKTCPSQWRDKKYVDYVDFLKTELSFRQGENLTSFYQRSPKLMGEQIEKGFKPDEINCS
ncbi:M15 family metallopeptidase [Endozoicomonas arenosclerae]|uniref:M15 family metallopeptidase n=1 Tax=Endozoicomonas arenosclerae TaxID=1633495 RepID=UPI000780DEC0|nr:M15 family metallopeptidase [Endozoicomonas arenosclerae]